jgi:uncharacterized protein (TIGR02453 family)
MAAYFGDPTFRFLRSLALNNERAWFNAHRADYEQHVRAPFQRLLVDLQPALAAISPYFRSDPRNVGGSLYRIQRDTRRYADKSPYKSWQGAELFYERRHSEAPSFFIHLQDGASFVGAGLWYPTPATMRRVRQFIVDNPSGWRAAAHAEPFCSQFTLDNRDLLVRGPRGFPLEFEFANDLRRKNLLAMRPVDNAGMTADDLLARVEHDLAVLAPFVDYLCAALDLEF